MDFDGNVFYNGSVSLRYTIKNLPVVALLGIPLCACSLESNHIRSSNSDDDSDTEIPIDDSLPATTPTEDCNPETVDWASVPTHITSGYDDKYELFTNTCLNTFPSLATTYSGERGTVELIAYIDWQAISRYACGVEGGYSRMRSIGVDFDFGNGQVTSYTRIATTTSTECQVCEIQSSKSITLVTQNGLIIDFGQDFRFELLKNGEGENTAAVLYPEASTVVESLVFRESSSQYYEFETRSLLRIAPNCDPWPVPYK